jgi:hypothetical protein
MKSHRDQGLGGSLLLFGVALLGGLMLIAMPVYLFSGGTRLTNPGLAAYEPPPGASLIRRRDPKTLELANLARDEIVDAKQIAAASAKSKPAERTRTAKATSPRSRGQSSVADMRYAEPPSRGLFFGLF